MCLKLRQHLPQSLLFLMIHLHGSISAVLIGLQCRHLVHKLDCCFIKGKFLGASCFLRGGQYRNRQLYFWSSFKSSNLVSNRLLARLSLFRGCKNLQWQQSKILHLTYSSLGVLALVRILTGRNKPRLPPSQEYCRLPQGVTLLNLPKISSYCHHPIWLTLAWACMLCGTHLFDVPARQPTSQLLSCLLLRTIGLLSTSWSLVRRTPCSPGLCPFAKLSAASFCPFQSLYG